MNALVKKEVRLLLPGFIAGVLIALVIWLSPKDLGSDITPLLFCLTMLMISLATFGREFGSETFSMLLSQPVPRTRIWRTKIVPSAVMVMLVWFVWCVPFVLYNPYHYIPPHQLQRTGIGTLLLALTIYSGGLWSVLLFRQVAVAFWFTILTPGVLWVTIINLLHDSRWHDVSEQVGIAALIVYGIAGFVFARWLFLNAQDAQWTGGNVSMPGWIASLRARCVPNARQRHSFTGIRRTWRPRAALLVKEFQLHQAQIIMAGVLALLHIGVIATRKIGGFQQNSPVEVLLESFWMLWLVMPVLVGCAAVAEERKTGTLEGQLCLPVKRRTQFALKFFVVIGLAVVMGAVMPMLLEGSRIFLKYTSEYEYEHGATYSQLVEASYIWCYLSGCNVVATNICGRFALNILAAILFSLPQLTFVAISAGVATISFYSSTLARNTFQALAPAVLGILLTWFLLCNACAPEEYIRIQLWRGPLIYIIAVPVLAVVLVELANWNYRHLLLSWKVWRKNLLTLAIVLALVGASTSAIYHRTWELLTPLEPPHGTAQLAPGKTGVRVSEYHIKFDITVFMPDGRVLLNRYNFAPSLFTLKLEEDRRFGGGRFLDGTNWLDVERSHSDLVGIQRDGSLWASEKPEQSWWGRQVETLAAPVPEGYTKLIRVGNVNDWKNVLIFSNQCILLKNNGTLWLWGSREWWGSEEKWPGLRTFTPQQLGTSSDWAETFTIGDRTYFRKANGEVWVLGNYGASSDKTARMELFDNFPISRAPYMESKKWRSVSWFGWRAGLVGICEDGTLRELACWKEDPKSHLKMNFLAACDIQIGKESNWLKITSDHNRSVLLKADGTLWQCVFQSEHPDASHIKRFSNYSDWVDIRSTDLNSFIALAADGSLWFWWFEPEQYSRHEPHLLLAQSRRPQYLGNIFSKEP